MMRTDFIELFRYTHYSNQKLIEKILEYDEIRNVNTEKLINHILNAHCIWNSRITGSEAYDVWEIHKKTELLQLDLDNFRNTIAILSNFNLERSISYQNSKGEAFSNSITDILYHVVNHSTYHRAQIAMNFKAKGLEPIVTDYIFYKREKNS